MNAGHPVDYKLLQYPVLGSHQHAHDKPFGFGRAYG